MYIEHTVYNCLVVHPPLIRAIIQYQCIMGDGTLKHTNASVYSAPPQSTPQVPFTLLLLRCSSFVFQCTSSFGLLAGAVAIGYATGPTLAMTNRQTVPSTWMTAREWSIVGGDCISKAGLKS